MKQLTTSYWRPALHRYFPSALFFFSIVIFALNWLRVALGSYQVNQFDGALRLLPHYYVRLGLVPYQNFGVVYPPGLFWLIGIILPFTSLVERNLILLSVFSAFLLLSGLVVWKMAFGLDRPDRLVAFSFFLLSGLVLLQNFGNEPLSLPLLMAIFSLSMLYLTESKLGTKFLAYLSFLAIFPIFLRWDWFLFAIILQVLATVFIFSITSICHITRPNIFNRWGRLIIAQAIGYAVGVLILALGLCATKTTSQAWEFLITVPTQVIFAYRRLPLPSFGPLQNINDTLYVALFSFIWIAGFIAITLNRRPKSLVEVFNWLVTKIPEIFLLTFPLAFLPYALGRADWQHALPLWQISTLAIVLFGVLHHVRLKYWLIMPILFLPLLHLLIIFPQHWHPEVNRYINDINRDLADCRQLTQASASASLFVGQKQYDHYIINSPMLYLVREKVPPATAFISDEPGLQNSCDYGSRIANQLRSAPKPMLSFLEIKPQISEPNATAHMLSCGKIEQYLNSAEFTLIGQCNAFEKKFEVRLYH